MQTVCDGTCCLLVGSAGDEEVEPEDYVLYDARGNVLTDTVPFEFADMTKTIRVVERSRNRNAELPIRLAWGG